MGPGRPGPGRHLLPVVSADLLEFLDGLRPQDWLLPTPCPGWTVHKVALHLLSGDLSKLSRGRDGTGEAAAASLAELNRRRVAGLRYLSPRVTVELLAWAAPQVHAHLAAQDPLAAGEPVSWAAPGPAPGWLDVARELTERWVHQQQLREALGRPGGDGPELVGPVLATFARSLPRALERFATPLGCAVRRTVTGSGGASWDVVREADGWALYDRVADAEPQVVVTTDAGTAWRAAVRGLEPGEVRARAEIEGDPALAAAVLGAVAVIV